MSDNLGVLGEQSVLTVGTTTVYQVGAGKAARVRIMYRCIFGANGTLKITVNGIDIMETAAQTAGDIGFSSNALLFNEQAAASSIDGTTLAKTVMPFAYDFWLSAGDILSYTVGTADMTGMSFQALGIEVDV